MAIEALQEYLVKLGWDIDNLGLAQATNKIDGFKNKIMGLGNGVAGSFFQAGAAVFSFIEKTSLATYKLLDVTAQADLAVERFARRMWTTEESARAFLSALDSMDADFQDVFYMTPEEYRRLMDLRNLGRELQAPEGLQDGLRLVRDIGHELNRLKVTANYVTQWVSYYLTKYLGNNLTDIRENLRKFNDWVIEHIPSATEKIAKFLSIIFKLGSAAARTILNLVDLFKRFFDSLSSGAKLTAGVITGFIALFKFGPIGIFIAGLLTLLALLDDFYTWQRGGKSAFGDTWAKLSKAFGSVDTSGLEGLLDKLGILLETLGKIGSALFDLGGKLLGFLEDIGAFRIAWNLLNDTLDFVVDSLQAIADLLLIITGNFDKLGENSIFKKLIKVDEQGNFAGLDMGGIADEAGGFIDRLLNGIGSFIGPNPLDVSSLFDYLLRNSTETAARSSGAVAGGTNAGGGKGSFVQNNNITVTAAPGESAEGTAQKTSRAILRQRNQYDPFK